MQGLAEQMKAMVWMYKKSHQFHNDQINKTRELLWLWACVPRRQLLQAIRTRGAARP
jgi:hypothetical protein